MKKVFLLSLGLLVGMAGFAQQQVVKKGDVKKGVAKANVTAVGAETITSASNYAPVTATSVVRAHDPEGEETMWSNYDLQSNQYVANRMYQMPNGNVVVTATMSHQASQSCADRGTGYAIYNAEDDEWTDNPDSRVEPFRTGWPSIAQWGENGEILLCHGGGGSVASGMQCFVRETAGEGEWIHKGTLPPYPDGYPYTDEYPTWPRVVTCGDNNNIIVAVGALQHSIDDDNTDVRTVMWRSTDAVNWTVSYGPLADLETPYHIGFFSADDYCMASYGHTVALLYSGCMTNSTWLFKSTDDGLTWNGRRVWEDPYEGMSLDDTTLCYTDTLFRPMNGAVTLTHDGTVHVVLNTFEMTHDTSNDPGYYSYWSGWSVDGILYWNDRQEGPIADKEHPEYIGTPYEEHFAHANPHHAARLWWPAPDEKGYVKRDLDSLKWAGFLPVYGSLSDWDNNKYFFSTGNKEYVSKLYGTSGHPALVADPYGNLACAYSAPNMSRVGGGKGAKADYYLRSIYVNYYNVDEGCWKWVEEDLTDDFSFEESECLFTNSITNSVNPGEYWFSFQSDDECGFYIGNTGTHTQTSATQNFIIAMKVNADPEYVGIEEQVAQDVVYEIYPNPATDYVVVKSSMDANAVITFTNLAGQTVKSFNKSLNLGENSISINLESGVYFMTVNANGFSKTTKVVVK